MSFLRFNDFTNAEIFVLYSKSLRACSDSSNFFLKSSLSFADFSRLLICDNRALYSASVYVFSFGFSLYLLILFFFFFFSFSPFSYSPFLFPPFFSFPFPSLLIFLPFLSFFPFPLLPRPFILFFCFILFYPYLFLLCLYNQKLT